MTKLQKAKSPAQLYCTEHPEELIAMREKMGGVKQISNYGGAVNRVWAKVSAAEKREYQEKAERQKKGDLDVDEKRK